MFNYCKEDAVEIIGKINKVKRIKNDVIYQKKKILVSLKVDKKVLKVCLEDLKIGLKD